MADADWEWAVHAFYEQLEAEYERCAEFLSTSECEAFRRYYASIPEYRRQTHRRLGAVSAWSSRLLPLIAGVAGAAAGPGRTVLDAGSGYGSEAILLGHLGVSVTGVDLRADRTCVARKRAQYYNAIGYCTVTPEFMSRNILTHLAERRGAYDAIWSQASIEHIEPTRAFLELGVEALKPGGRIVITNVNKLNPIVSVRLMMERGWAKYSEREDPETGKLVPYAVERVYSTFELRRLLERAGFTRIDVQYHSFTPVTAREWIGHRNQLRLDRTGRRTPVLRHLAGSYTLVAHRD
jgi:SAM-dependent methyltransferase